MEKSTKFIQISDLYIISYLLCSGYKYHSIDRSLSHGSNKIIFYFLPDAQKAIDAFFNGEECPAISYKNAIENVKSLLFDFK